MIYDFFKVNEGYRINTTTSHYLIEQKITTPILLDIFLFGLLCLFLKIVSKSSHNPKSIPLVKIAKKVHTLIGRNLLEFEISFDICKK